jgi:SAM-dependent methyltransferase
MSRIDDRAPFEAIRTCPVPACRLCGAEGAPLYAGLRDRSYGAPGSWSFRSCPNAGCALIWLDPAPAEGEAAKAYRNYYTHRSFSPPAGESAVDRALLAVYFAADNLLSRITGLGALQRRAEVMYLDGVSPGRLLDVGCGDGTIPARLRRLGWSAEGTEVDPEAAAHARTKHGLTVHLGSLETLGLSGDSFDAVVMNHVVEHVHDPVALLRECRRILRPGGRLVVVTPNTKSLGHRIFGKDWGHLDPPRHLHLFSRSSLRECAQKAGIGIGGLWCTPANAGAVFPESVRNRSPGRKPKGVRSKIFRTGKSFLLKYYELLAARRDPEAGEEVVLSGEKL